ncbi:8818_t:CDS:2, partial [Paraglomus occultum]
DIGYFQGHSSGAHLSALVTVLDALCPLVGNKWKKSLKPKSIDPTLNMPKVAGLILMSGIFDIQQHYYWESKRGLEEVSGMARAMGKDVMSIYSLYSINFTKAFARISQ